MPKTTTATKTDKTTLSCSDILTFASIDNKTLAVLRHIDSLAAHSDEESLKKIALKALKAVRLFNKDFSFEVKD